MARILYGVAGEGFGHSSRSELLGQRLINAGHTVLFAASRKSYSYLKPTFQDAVQPVYGLSFYCRNGRVYPMRTLWQNIAGYPKGAAANRRLFADSVEPFEPDLVISDFEPFSAWWAQRHRVPCVSIDHEHVLTCCELDGERALWKERLLAQIVTRGYHTFADAYLIPNFFKAPVTNAHAALTPPVVRNIVLNQRPESGEHVVMYATGADEKMRQRILDIAQSFRRHRFYVYGFNRDLERGNCVFKKTSTDGFIRDLASCRGVIATAGFSLISECLHFRKPMLLIPLQDQYEQLLNTFYVEKLGLGQRSDTLTGECVGSFLSNLDTPLKTHPLVEYPDNEKFFSIVDNTFKHIGFDLNLCGSSPKRALCRRSQIRA
ncbi:MAG: glycosyltransferase family protein [Planctomycetota bacterium]